MYVCPHYDSSFPTAVFYEVIKSFEKNSFQQKCLIRHLVDDSVLSRDASAPGILLQLMLFQFFKVM